MKIKVEDLDLRRGLDFVSAIIYFEREQRAREGEDFGENESGISWVEDKIEENREEFKYI